MFRPANWIAFLLGLLAVWEAIATDPRQTTTVVREWRNGELVLSQQHAAKADGARPADRPLEREMIRMETLAALRERFDGWYARRRALAERNWHEASGELRKKFDDNFDQFLRKFDWNSIDDEGDFPADGELMDAGMMQETEESLRTIFEKLAALDEGRRAGALERLSERLAASADRVARHIEPPAMPAMPLVPGVRSTQVVVPEPPDAEAVVVSLDDIDSAVVEFEQAVKSSRGSRTSRSSSSSGRDRFSPVLPSMGAMIGAYVVLKSMTNRRLRLSTRIG